LSKTTSAELSRFQQCHWFSCENVLNSCTNV